MGKNNKKRPPVPDEAHLLLPTHPALADPAQANTPIVDTHTHLISTFSEYRRKYPAGNSKPSMTSFVDFTTERTLLLSSMFIARLLSRRRGKS